MAVIQCFANARFDRPRMKLARNRAANDLIDEQEAVLFCRTFHFPRRPAHDLLGQRVQIVRGEFPSCSHGWSLGSGLQLNFAMSVFAPPSAGSCLIVLAFRGGLLANRFSRYGHLGASTIWPCTL